MKSVISILLALLLVGCVDNTSTVNLVKPTTITFSTPSTTSTMDSDELFTDAKSIRKATLAEFIHKLNPTVDKNFIRRIVFKASDIADSLNSNAIDMELILAIIWVESHFKNNAFNQGSVGLMQVEEKSHRDLIRGRSLYNPNVNMEVGTTVLLSYYKTIGNMKGALLAYNAGIGNYFRHRVNSVYFDKVNTMHKLFKAAL